MGFLGLDGQEVKDDNLFQRMFWPSDHAGEADTLGVQGFWVCWVVGVLSFVMLALQGQWLVALLALAFYCMAGIGVREHSQPAAVLVAATYSLNIVASIFLGVPPGVLPVIAALLLIANIRGTFIAAKWADAGGTEAMPDRMNETLVDKLVDQMPKKVWPVLKIPFFCVAALFLLMTLFGIVMIAMGTPHRFKATQVDEPPSQTIQVTPSR